MNGMTRKKILLVDDVQLFLDQQKTFFNRDDFELIFARSGKEALEVAQKTRPDLIFMDLYMPEMDGDECCRIIKKSEPLRDVPVIMVTSGLGQEDFEQCWQAGCDDVIVKPINQHYFNAIVKKYLPVTERKSTRFIARLRVEYGPDQESLLDDYSVNMSTGGLFLETANPLPAESLLTLSFTLPRKGVNICCSGRVAWVNHPEFIKNKALPAGMGIQFIDLSLNDLYAIRDYIRSGALLPSW
jgi:uncharacterized protein (TIGR02266 family)